MASINFVLRTGVDVESTAPGETSGPELSSGSTTQSQVPGTGNGATCKSQLFPKQMKIVCGQSSV